MKLFYDHVDWGKDDEYYFYWWNPLPKGVRYIGRSDMIFEYVHATFGLWFFNLSWSTPYTKFRKR